MTLEASDPFFHPKVMLTNRDEVDANSKSVYVKVHLVRTLGTLFFAVFLMVLMWGLTWAALTVAWFVINGRRGLLWPTCTFLAALLFALIPLRNAAPGASPIPIGSIIDYVAFFVAELVIASALIFIVIIGYRVELRKEREETATATVAEAAAGEPAGPEGPVPAGVETLSTATPDHRQPRQ